MADSYQIIDDQVVPYSGGRMHTDTTCWRDASELELEQQQRIKELEEAIYKMRLLAEDGEGDHQAAPSCCAGIAKIAYDV